MIRTLLATTALTAMLVTGAYADSDTKSMDEKASHGGAAVFMMSPDAMPMESQNGYFAAAQGQILATTLIGKSLYNGAGEDAKAIGDVNDVVLASNGTAEAVVVGVGGFLGVGEKDVAIDFDRIGWVERDGDMWLTIAATEEELEQAPAFDRELLVAQTERTADPDANREMSAAEADEKANPDAARDMAAADAKADEQNTRVVVDASTISAEELIGTTVYDANEENLGDIGDVIVSADGKVVAYIIDVGGFLGIGEKPVALDARNLEIMKDDAGDYYIYTSFSEDQLKGFPEYSEDAYKKNPDAVLVK